MEPVARPPISAARRPRQLRALGLAVRTAESDMQYAMRHSDSCPTLRYDLSRANLDRHAAHPVAAYLAGMAVK
jgi:hypothetical protein